MRTNRTQPQNAPTPFGRDTSSFAYTIDGPRPRVTDEQLLESLRRFAAAMGDRPPWYAEFNRWSEKPCTARIVVNRFGGWRRALRIAGVPEVPASDHRPAELMDYLRRLWRKKGRVPTKADLKHGEISSDKYKRRWGSLRRACELLAKFERGRITRAYLLQERIPIRPRERWEVLARDGHRCRGCGCKPPEVILEVDHIVPVSKGGTNELSNLRALCASCNSGKGGRFQSPERKRGARRARCGPA